MMRLGIWISKKLCHSIWIRVFFHGGLESSAGQLGGKEVLPPFSITSSFNGDGIHLSSTAEAAEINTDLSSRGFWDDTLCLLLWMHQHRVLILNLLLV